MLKFSLWNVLEETISHYFTFLSSQIYNLSRDCYDIVSKFSDTLGFVPPLI